MNTGLILVDIQNDYFAGGRMALVGMEEAAENASQLLAYFRDNQKPTFHIQHISTREGATFFLPNTQGVEIHVSVKPELDDPVIRKHYPNSFRETVLLDALERAGVDNVVICGAMSHMCIDATTGQPPIWDFNAPSSMMPAQPATLILDPRKYWLKTYMRPLWPL
ncbi:MAG: cysteine hydrolase family protein [Desulfobacterales bacterium]